MFNRSWGFVSLQVGVSVWSANFIMLAMIMIITNASNVFNVIGTNFKYCFIFICVTVLILGTWVMAFIGCYENSLKLVAIAVKIWLAFICLWIILSLWSLFLTTDNERREGFTCSSSRCVHSCYLIKYLKYKTFDYSTNNSTSNTTSTQKTSTKYHLMMIGEYDASTAYYYEDSVNYDINAKSVRQFNHSYMVNVSGSYWEIIIVPLIFLAIFLIARSTLCAFLSELENVINQECNIHNIKSI